MLASLITGQCDTRPLAQPLRAVSTSEPLHWPASTNHFEDHQVLLREESQSVSRHIRAVMDAMAPGLITELPSEPSGCERFETAIPVSAAPGR